jgi:hypothetical protein
MPQFHKRVVVAVQNRPLMASAVQAVRLTRAKGNGLDVDVGQRSQHQGSHVQTISIAVPERMV